MASIMGSRVWEWVFLKSAVNSAIVISSSTMATEATRDELSIPKIRIYVSSTVIFL